jgi:hypothetical protein
MTDILGAIPAEGFRRPIIHLSLRIRPDRAGQLPVHQNIPWRLSNETP